LGRNKHQHELLCAIFRCTTNTGHHGEHTFTLSFHAN